MGGFSASISERDWYDTVLLRASLPDGSTLIEVATRSKDGRYRVTEMDYTIETEFPNKEDYMTKSGYCAMRQLA